ncbi:MAG: GerMN domain-containing protein [Candidatus Aminicenantes bacterium]
MDAKKITILGALVVVLLVLAFAFFWSGGEEKIRHSLDESLQEGDALSEETLQTRTITLYFLSKDDNYLHSEKREIVEHPSLVRQAIQSVEELLNGSQQGLLSPLPEGTELREFFITKRGVAYVDFSGEIRDEHLSGTSAEMGTVFSVVNTLTYNFKSIKKVFILIDGSEKETLAGHIDLSRPLVPRYDLVSNSP